MYPAASRYQWQAESYPESHPIRRGFSTWRLLVLCIGLPLTAAAAAGTWLAFWPATLVQTRIVTDLGGPAGRAALAEAALRIVAAQQNAASLENHGETLVIAAEDQNRATAERRAHSAADTLLALSLATWPGTPLSLPLHGAGQLARSEPGTRATLLDRQNRLQAMLSATDNRLAGVSASLTGIVRDIASGVRIVADRKAGHETLDKAQASLAELQLQRIQLQGRYQDDYPAVLAVEGQIRNLRSFLQDESHRIESVAKGQADPADPVLGAERDRLRTELAQLNDRRVSLAAELAGVTRALAETGPDQPAPRTPSPLPPATSPTPILLEASTTVASLPDHRWIAVPAATGVGLLMVLLAWIKPPRRHQTVLPDLLLRRLELALAHEEAVAALPPGGRPTLTGDGIELAEGVRWFRRIAANGGSGAKLSAAGSCRRPPDSDGRAGYNRS